jgi:hypothetical protein
MLTRIKVTECAALREGEKAKLGFVFEEVVQVVTSFRLLV